METTIVDIEGVNSPSMPKSILVTWLSCHDVLKEKKKRYLYNTLWGELIFITSKYLKLNTTWEQIPTGRRRSTKLFTTTAKELHCVAVVRTRVYHPYHSAAFTKQKTKFVVLVVGSECPTFLSLAYFFVNVTGNWHPLYKLALTS